MIGNATNDDNKLENWGAATSRVEKFFGTMHLIIMLIVLAYLIGSYIRKHRLSKFQWVFLIVLMFIELFTAIVQYGYFGLGDDDNHNCFYSDKVFYGSGEILLFNMSILIGYKLYLEIDNLYEFAVKGNLMSTWRRRRNHCILVSLWALSGINVSVYIFFNTYWTFIERDMYTLQIFNFVNRLSDIGFMSLNAFLYFLAYIYLNKTLKFS